MRIVLDTASLVSAVRSNLGASAEVVRLALRGDFIHLMDQKLGLEYRDVALRPEHLAVSTLSAKEIVELIELLEERAIPVKIIHKRRPLSSDLAINGAADAIATRNTRHFAVAAREFGILVLTPAELLERRREQDADRSR